jgi:hypothetical protein
MILRRLTLRLLRSLRAGPVPSPRSAIPRPAIPSRSGSRARTAPAVTGSRRWGIHPVASVRHALSHAHRTRRRHPRRSMTVMANQHRERQQHDRCNQAAAPPTILFQDLLLEAIEARFEARALAFPLITRDTRFFRHKVTSSSYFCGYLHDSQAARYPLASCRGPRLNSYPLETKTVVGAESYANLRG